MQPPSKLKGWANEETQLDSSVPLAVQPVEVVVAPEEESDDEYQVLAKKSQTPAQKASAEPKAAPIMTTGLPEEQEGDTDALNETEAAPDTATLEQGPVSDADWLRSRTNRVLDLVEDDEPPSRDVAMIDADKAEVVEDTPNEVEQPHHSVRESEAEAEVEADTIPSEEDKIRETGRLFLRNLHYDVTEDDLREHFSAYGAIDEVRLFLTFTIFLL
jgi:multiple RNA-binding domain-containing protein 1